MSPLKKDSQLDSHAHQGVRNTVLEAGLPDESFQRLWARDTLWRRNRNAQHLECGTTDFQNDQEQLPANPITCVY